MVFRIDDRERQSIEPWVGEWHFPERARFITSDAYDTFSRELQRYVSGEVKGRSFLVAGHRGAGKTSMVRQAVEDLNRRIIDSAFRSGGVPSPITDRTVAPQRPLLVKLHGPSLIEPDKAGANAGAATVGPHPLVHVTIALYRALA